MPLARREALVDLARKYDALVVCDDVYDFLQWPLDERTTPERSANMRLPRLCDIERSMPPSEHDPKGFGHSVSNGSFSKIAGPGVRTGWVEASPAFAAGLARTGSTLSGGAPSQLAAAILADLVKSGQLQQYIEERTRPALQRRHRLLMDALDEYISPLGATLRRTSIIEESDTRGDKPDIYGGYFVWFSLHDDDLPTKLIADVAKMEENLIIGNGSMFAVRGDEDKVSFDKDIRLCFSWEPEGSLVEGVRRLGAVIQRVRENRSSYEELVGKEQDGTITQFK